MRLRIGVHRNGYRVDQFLDGQPPGGQAERADGVRGVVGEDIQREYVAAPAETLAAAPCTVELAEAAALPSVGLAAWQALFEHAEVKAGRGS